MHREKHALVAEQLPTLPLLQKKGQGMGMAEDDTRQMACPAKLHQPRTRLDCLAPCNQLLGMCSAGHARTCILRGALTLGDGNGV